jgi:TonB-dependent starch-binding outer membrane protein SusC
MEDNHYNRSTKARRIAILIGWMLTATIIQHAQGSTPSLLDKNVTVTIVNKSLGDALHAIETAADVRFMYSPDQVNLNDKVSVKAQKRKLREVLDELFTPRKVRYNVHDGTNTITLNKENEEPQRGQPKEKKIKVEALALQPITGKVTEAKTKLPMAGINVVVKGTTQGTTTDADGNFSISVNEGDILVFSFIGFQPVEIKVAGQTMINIALEEDIKGLSEVVVNAGYWKIKEHEQTGNIAKLSSDDISKQPINNPLLSLQGRLAGVYIQQQSGVPGSALTIQIRGQNSLRNSPSNNGNLPLYIIDGVPFTSNTLGTSASASIIDGGNPLSTINPSDIESIEILKDADATAIYGSRGANGVVLITTKKGQAGKTEFTTTYYEGWGTTASKMNLLNTQQYLAMRNEAFVNDQVTPGTYSSDHDLLSWDTDRYTDWQKELLGGTARMTNAQLSIGGGSAQTKFLVAGGYLRETSVFPGSFANQKLSTNFKINHRSTNEKWNIGFSAYYLVDNNKLPRIDLTRQALSLAPNAPAPYLPNGNLNWENSTWRNPLAFTRQQFETKTTNLLGNVIVSYKILPTLEARVNFGYSNVRMDEYSSQPKISFDPSRAAISSATFADRQIQTWITEPTLEYSRPIGEGTLTALVGTTFQSSSSKLTDLSARGFPSDALLRNPQAASSLIVQSANQSEYRYNAFFGRLNYNWKGKYIANLTGRRDASSRFGTDKQFANFGAVGAAWIFTEEPWMQSSMFASMLTFGKIRTSYGITGSDQIADYGYVDLWTSTAYPYDGGNGLYPLNLANPNYAWEENRKWEVALETGFWKDRLNISVSYYRHRSSNQLVGLPLPGTTGFSSVQANLPAEVQNTGIELVLTSTNVKNDRFTWTTSFNATVPQNKLLRFPDIKNSSFAYDYIVGEPLTVQPSFHYTGVNPQTGLYQHEDVNSDGSLSFEDDLQGKKSIAQSFFGGLQNAFTYKGFSLDILVQFVKQTGRNYLNYFYDRPGAAANQPMWVLDRWQKPGDQATIQQYTQGFGDASLSNLYNNYSDNRFGDASFIRLKNISLSYQFPARLLKQMRVQQMRIFIQAQNLGTITGYEGLDPETQSASLPPLKMITIGGQLKF